MISGVKYVVDSSNSKIAGSNKVDSTYASIEASCSSACPLKQGECYAQNSFTGFHVRKLDEASKGKSPLQIARQEAASINDSYNGKKIPAGRDLRIHVSGDSRTIQGTRLINKAVGNWKLRGGNDVWTYTHSWRHVPRKEWSNVSILASVDSIKDVNAARKQGYAPALIVAEHISDKAYSLPESKIKWIPCPNQTKEDVSCSSCRLCFNADRLFQGHYGIAFAAHGINKNKIKRRLAVIQ
jgi:hypothetical protein